MNVYDKPQKPQSTMIAKGAENTPTSIHATPMPRYPTISDNLRLYVSATTPVGTSKTKIAASIAVPMRTSWSGEKCNVRTR